MSYFVGSPYVSVWHLSHSSLSIVVYEISSNPEFSLLFLKVCYKLTMCYFFLLLKFRMAKLKN